VPTSVIKKAQGTEQNRKLFIFFTFKPFQPHLRLWMMHGP